MALLAASANTTVTISLKRNGPENRIHKHASLGTKQTNG